MKKKPTMQDAKHRKRMRLSKNVVNKISKKSQILLAKNQ